MSSNEMYEELFDRMINYQHLMQEVQIRERRLEVINRIEKPLAADVWMDHAREQSKITNELADLRQEANKEMKEVVDLASSPTVKNALLMGVPLIYNRRRIVIRNVTKDYVSFFVQELEEDESDD